MGQHSDQQSARIVHGRERKAEGQKGRRVNEGHRDTACTMPGTGWLGKRKWKEGGDGIVLCTLHATRREGCCGQGSKAMGQLGKRKKNGWGCVHNACIVLDGEIC